MRIEQLVEVCWRWYQNGRAYANDQRLLEADMSQKVKLLFADTMRQRYYESKRSDAYNQADYSFSSPVLSIKRFILSEADIIGKRRVDMSEFDLYRLPGNSHITNIYPYSEKGCGNDEVGEITLVAPGEENFYVKNPDLKEFKFGVIKGRGLDTYNIPPCVTGLDIESTYDVKDVDIDMSIGSLIIDQILNVSLGIRKQYYSEEVQKQMAEQNIVK